MPGVWLGCVLVCSESCVLCMCSGVGAEGSVASLAPQPATQDLVHLLTTEERQPSLSPTPATPVETASTEYKVIHSQQEHVHNMSENSLCYSDVAAPENEV